MMEEPRMNGKKQEWVSQEDVEAIVGAAMAHYPDLQAVYLFGSYGTEQEWPDSDVDIALLLRHEEARRAGALALSELRFALEEQLKKTVDLINLREVSTVFQHEITQGGLVIFAPDEEAVRAFEMGVLSAYQKLNEERREIISEFLRTKRAYAL